MAEVDEHRAEQRSGEGRSYHHGDLPNALRSAALELIEEVGPTAFSLREVARRAGVSHAAPAHHFGDKAGLLTSIATEGFELLSEVMSDVVAAHDDPIERFVAQGEAYVRMARTNRAHFAVMWQDDIHHHDDPAFDAAGLGAFQCLVETIEAIAAAYDPDLDVRAASMMAWSLSQGLSELTDAIDSVDEKYADDLPSAATATPDDELVEAVLRLSIRGLVPGLGTDDPA
ncbi:MAG: TetR/AcrR family transcriptional regulator [Actinomycetota bacterium]